MLLFLFELKTNHILPFSIEHYQNILSLPSIQEKGEFLSMIQLLCLLHPGILILYSNLLIRLEDKVLSSIQKDLHREISYNEIESSIYKAIQINKNISLQPKELILFLEDAAKKGTIEEPSKSFIHESIDKIKHLYSLD